MRYRFRIGKEKKNLDGERRSNIRGKASEEKVRVNSRLYTERNRRNEILRSGKEKVSMNCVLRDKAKVRCHDEYG